MTDATRKKVMFGVLGLAIIYGAANIKWSSQTASVPYSNDLDTNSGMSIGQPKTPAFVINIDSALATPWAGDPFRLAGRSQPAATVDVEQPKWQLSGIVYIPGKAMAVINSRPVKEGDVINDAAVIKIDRDAVTLELRGNRFTIGVNEG